MPRRARTKRARTTSRSVRAWSVRAWSVRLHSGVSTSLPRSTTSLVAATPLLVAATPLLVAVTPLVAVDSPLVAVETPLVAVATPLVAVATPLAAVATPLVAVATPLVVVAPATACRAATLHLPPVFLGPRFQPLHIDRTLYTVTNVPNAIQIPAGIAVNVDETKSWSDMQRPQGLGTEVPEAPYLLRGAAPNDVLLSRLGRTFSEFTPTRYPREYSVEWGLELETRKSWTRLEKGLHFVSDILLTAASRDREYINLRPFPHWRPPIDTRYRELHSTEHAARRAIHRAREAFMFLAARCSLAIAVWRKPGEPEHAWIAELARQGVDASWIDALQSSIISQFGHGLRVGAFINAATWPGLAHLPVLRRHYIPIFVRWKDPSRVEAICAAEPRMREFAPRDRDAELAYRAPPLQSAPNNYTLFYHGEQRIHPYRAGLGADIPRGHSQMPRESFEAFVRRMESLCRHAISTESTAERHRRIRRLRAAISPGPPAPWVPVYLWLKIGECYHTEPSWADFDIRLEVHSEAVPGIWDHYPARCRYFNFVFNEWDLIPQPVAGINEGQSEVSAAAWRNHSEWPLLEEGFAEDVEYLYPHLNVPAVELTHDLSVVSAYYGVHAVMHPAPGVDYQKYEATAHKVLGLKREDLHNDGDLLRTCAGWIGAMLAETPYCDATRDCWDLSQQSAHYIHRPLSWRSRLRIQLAPATTLANFQLYFVQFAAQRPSDPHWILGTNAATVLYIIRNHSISTNVDAAAALCEVGLPFHTLQLADHAVKREEDPSLRRYALPRYRREGVKMTKKDYEVYQRKVLNIIRRRPIRAALMAGGIAWRLVREFLACDPDLKHDVMESVLSGPSTESRYHSTIVAGENDVFYVDNVLTRDEEDILMGVHRMYTEQAGQTEDASWWPRLNYWYNSGMNNGIWSAWDEEWFRSRQKEIRSGWGTLNNGKKWRSVLGGHRLTLPFTRIFMRECEKYLVDAD
ncbi:hypothetical protein C8Q76DRAFT_795191 [Earliella scabrosa]|nr:hypothetical protein C8Q76DRAFT_795191 [Earliella scabrosa]